MGLFRKNKGDTWSELNEVRAGDSVRNRDVHSNQKLKRSKIGDKYKNKTEVNVLTGVTFVFSFIGVWLLVSLIMAAFGFLANLGNNNKNNIPDVEYEEVAYYLCEKEISGMGINCHILDENGAPIGEAVSNETEVSRHKPQWAIDEDNRRQLEAAKEAGYEEPVEEEDSAKSVGNYFTDFNIYKILIVGSISALIAAAVNMVLNKQRDVTNVSQDMTDINQHTNDQHIQTPEELQRNYDFFPNAGAHSSVSPTSMISHMAISNKGIKNVDITVRHKKDVLDEDGDVEHYKGEPVFDKNDNLVTERLPMFDTDFMDAVFEASEVLDEDQLSSSVGDMQGTKKKKLFGRKGKDSGYRVYYDATKIPYNPGNKNRDRLKGYDTLADLINGDWEIPYYEVQRPGGVYIVDTAPVNTMVLAITRAGKGQTVIEPTLDMWTREKRQNNILVNDPKGELLVKFFVPAVTRGYEVVQFNLINPIKTDIYNPLGMAAEAAREGDSRKCSTYVENVASVFFPIDGGDDPFWPSAANNAFKRAAYGLIDYYLEEERELRAKAAREGMDDKVLETKIDLMWGKVTLYNCYQFFVQLSGKKIRNGYTEFMESFIETVERENISQEDAMLIINREEAKHELLFDENSELDALSMFFNATKQLPQNSMRELVMNADNSLRAMGGSEKTISSVYGIAITGMNFFTDPTIAMMTSGTPSQNADLAGLSFPRRIGVRFHNDFMERYKLVGLRTIWSSYEDKNFTKKLGSEFDHADMLNKEGWARYYFDGIYDNDVAYIKLELVNPESGNLVRVFHFELKLNYRMSMDARFYVYDPITHEKIVKDGILRELVKDENGNFVYGNRQFKSTGLDDVSLAEPSVVSVSRNAIVKHTVRYSDKPKAVFMVTPPHLASYAKLLLILLGQLVNLNFEQSYMTKPNQKPLYETYFMLDELGNLQSEGKGIQNFETFLSIGLGQGQKFTIILQTLQQLAAVYPDKEAIIQGNAQPLTAKIATPKGFISMGEVEAGTEVLIPKGGTSKVKAV